MEVATEGAIPWSIFDHVKFLTNVRTNVMLVHMGMPTGRVWDVGGASGGVGGEGGLVVTATVTVWDLLGIIRIVLARGALKQPSDVGNVHVESQVVRMGNEGKVMGEC